MTYRYREARACEHRTCRELIPIERGVSRFCSVGCEVAERKARAGDRAPTCMAGDCSRTLIGSRVGERSFCSEECAGRHSRAIGLVADVTTPTPEGVRAQVVALSTARSSRSKALEDYVVSGHAQRVLEGTETLTAAAKALSTSKASLSKLHAQWRTEVDEAARVAGFTLSTGAKADLADFHAFRAASFKVPDVHGHVLHGVPYATPSFQQRWGVAIDNIIANPGILVILAPPRHGKSEFLAHKLIQLIVANANLRAMWVGGNEDIATASVEQVRDELGNNDHLSQAYTSGQGFRPPARMAGAAWKSGKFTVATRDVTGIKSPTLVAIGKGGKILSRDADLIVVDDIVDHASTLTDGRRKDDWTWFRTQLMSRREPHTAVVVIGSRQHFADIYSHLLADDHVTTIVDTAHDEMACRGDAQPVNHSPHGPSQPDGCLLFPELRSIEWLKGQEHALGRDLFEMVYLNRPRAEGTAMFNEAALMAARNRSRRLGLPSALTPTTDTTQIPPNCRLIGGLDPATKGYQAGFLWAVHPQSERQFMVDLDNEKGAGIEGGLALMQRWLGTYGLRYWVIEDNAAQHAYLQDRETREWASRNGVTIRGHHTNVNKWDANLGVSSLARLFERGLIDLPYGDLDSQRKTDLYSGQLLAFEATGVKRQLSDLVMASWFPQPTARSWRTDHLTQASQHRDPEFPWAEMAYPDLYSTGA